MVFANFWDIVLNPVFLIMFGLVLLPFLPLAASIWVTWEEGANKGEDET